MKKLFTAIRASDFEMVRQIIEKKPELVNCVAKKPPNAYGVGQRPVLRSKTAAERSERPPVYYKKVVILL